MPTSTSTVPLEDLLNLPSRSTTPAPKADVPTNEQHEILNYVEGSEGNFNINALAGTGKSSTLKMVADSADRYDSILYLVFNKSAREEAEKKFLGTRAEIKTLNGLGYGVWRKVISNASVNADKCKDILKGAISELKGQDRKDASESFGDILQAVGYGKSIGYVPDGKFPNAKRLATREELYASLDEKPDDITAYLIDYVLIASIKAAYAGSIDFNDQIYMPALFGGTFPRHSLVLIDEAQDLNPCNHEMLKKFTRSRIIAVGDPFQSIYGFRGAVQSGMDKIRATHSCAEKTISISFRCPRAIVENARWRVPHYKWVKDGGSVQALSEMSTADFVDGSAIICRNNAPLFALAFKLLSAKRSVSVTGSDIGPKLIKLLNKIGAPRDTSESLIAKIEGWKLDKLSRANAPDSIHDQAECLKVFATFGKNLEEAIAYANHILKAQGTLKLMTGHKAKGLEFDTVYHLDPGLIKDNRSDQEKNLRYVIQTRSKNAYFEINSNDII